MTDFYHVNEPMLTLGQPLKPAGWRSVDDYHVCRKALASPPHVMQAFLVTNWLREGLPLWMKEAIFEEVREAEAASTLSRMDSWYGWGTIELARQFGAEYKAGKWRIYRCDVPDDAVTSHYDMAYFDAASLDIARPIEPQIEHAKELAKLYFSSNPGQTPMMETLVNVAPIIRAVEE